MQVPENRAAAAEGYYRPSDEVTTTVVDFGVRARVETSKGPRTYSRYALYVLGVIPKEAYDNHPGSFNEELQQIQGHLQSYVDILGNLPEPDDRQEVLIAYAEEGYKNSLTQRAKLAKAIAKGVAGPTKEQAREWAERKGGPLNRKDRRRRERDLRALRSTLAKKKINPKDDPRGK